MSLRRPRHLTDTPSWEPNPAQHSHYSSRHARQQSQPPSSRHLHRHASDVSSDRIRSSYESASSSYRARMENKRTDYPVAPRKLTRESKSDVHVGLHTMADHQHSLMIPRDLGGGSQGSQGSQGSGNSLSVYREKRFSSNSLDRNSYSAADSRFSSFNGPFRDPVSSGGNKMAGTGIHFPASLRGSTGTPNSSQSDDSNIDRTNLSRPPSAHYIIPRSLSTQGTPLSSYAKGTGERMNDDIDGQSNLRQHPPPPLQGRQSFIENDSTYNKYRHHMSPVNYPQSPISPLSPSSSFSSESDRFPPNSQMKTIEKQWYEDDDPDIHSGIYFPNVNNMANRQSHHYETIPYHNGQDVPPGHIYNSHSPSPQPVPPAGTADRKHLEKQRLEYYFSRQEFPQSDIHKSHDRRESSPASYGRITKHVDSLGVESKDDRKYSDSEIMQSNEEYLKENGHKKVKRVKSTGIGFGKLVKKIKGRPKDDIIAEFRGIRSHSMENIDVKSHNSDTNLLRKAHSPAFTPKLSKAKHRQNSEPDLESALGLFRSGSKKNLFIDPVDALFEAIESQDYETCCSLLGEYRLDINSVNYDGWTPLDMAVMLNDQIAGILMQHGAKDSNKYFKDPGLRYHRILDLLCEAETEKKAIAEMSVNSKEMQKQMAKWRNKSQVLDKMLEAVQRTSIPGSPREVSLTVSSDRTLTVKFSEPISNNGSHVTRYRIQWSKSEYFAPESGEFIISDNKKEYTILGLDKGERYFVRVFAFNMKGFGPPKSANPSYAIPSSWHDQTNSRPRFEGCTNTMGAISMGLNRFLSEQQQLDAAGTPGTPNSNSRRSIKKGLTKLFSQGAKFCKTQKSGVYLASLIHSDEGRILVTVDDLLPTIEISDSHPKSIGTDFSWLTKLSCTWENVREMCESTEGHTTSPSIQFRFRLLQAIAVMQIGTGQTNLGLVHHKTFQDSQGSTVFLTVQYIEDYKSFIGNNNKWTNFVKLLKKYPQLDEVFGHELTAAQKTDRLSAVEQLIMDIPNIIHYHSNCHNTLTKGLYLGYMKARLSLASMTLVTSSTLPNVFPHYQIRPNPNISREEWAWVHSLGSPDYEVTLSRVGTGNQALQKTLLPSIDHFLEILGIPQEEVESHQLYIDEVIELNENVTFLLLMPPPDNVCTPPGAKDQFDGQHFSHLPISAFELLQLYTYQRAFVSNFSMVSCRLDIEIPICQKRMRESLSKSETEALKKIKEHFDKYHDETETVWKQMRWIEAAVQTARNTSSTSRLNVKHIRDRMKIIRKAMSTSSSSSSISTMLSSSSGGGTLSPSRKSLPSVNLAVPSRQLVVYPGYETGLAKGTTVRVQVNTSTTAFDVIKYSVSEFEQAGKRRQSTAVELKQFYLAAVFGHQEDILPLEYTPLQMLNYSNKYKFIVGRFTVNQCTTEV